MNTWASPRPPCPQYPTISTPTQLTPNPKRTELVPALVIQLPFPRLRGGVKRSRRKQNVDPKENLDNVPSGSHKATSSSPSVVVRGVERSQDNSLKDIVDKFGDHQIVKRKRKDGSFPCPFSKCRRKFTREKDLERHINSSIHLDALRTRCPAPRCLFEGARRDIVSKHQRKSEHGTDELGRCTCSALVCKEARNQSRRK